MLITQITIAVLIFIILILAYVLYTSVNKKNIAIYELEKKNEKLIYINEIDLKRIEDQKKELRYELSELTQKLIDERIKNFDETSAKSLENIIKPFKENLESFKQKVDNSQKESIARFASLSKEIEMVIKTGNIISEDTKNLTSALKGEKQAQGKWGEMILESVLDHSGLIKGEHYFVQENYKDEDGKYKRPDVIVKLPDDKSIIIDSKVSLVDYDQYIRSENEEKRAIESQKMVKAFKNHIDTLSSKKYTEYNTKTLQYIFMFVPIESAYAIASHTDPQLYEYALKNHIVIVYPSSLVVTLKTIYLYWQKEQSDIAVQKVFVEAGKLYDKVEGFIKTFDKVGSQLETLTKSYQTAQKQLYSGTGNIYKRTEDLKALGAKTTKSLQSEKLKELELANEEIS
jgi:DNA recombination protein RmuC